MLDQKPYERINISGNDRSPKRFFVYKNEALVFACILDNLIWCFYFQTENLAITRSKQFKIMPLEDSLSSTTCKCYHEFQLKVSFSS